jgi:glucokinase
VNDRRRAGIDVGGTKCLGVLLGPSGEVVNEVRLPTPSGAPAIVSTLVEIAEALGPVDSLGVGVPGLVTRTGLLRAAPNLPAVTEFAVAEHLAERLGRRVAVDNDATCAVLAEWQLGAGVGSSDLVMVTQGTGIGGGAVVSGRVQHGHNGFAGEYGHMVVDPAGPPCVCGRQGCWERYASGAGIARLAREAASDGRAAHILELAGGDLDAVRGEHVHRAASAGDAQALAVIDDFARWVALGLSNLTNAFDPEVFVLGGGLVTGAEWYLDPIRRWFEELLYSPHLRPHPRIVSAHLGERAGAIGAALLGDQPA